jgi:hypothetical protein
MVWLRKLCQTEFVEALRLSPVPLGKIERVQTLVHLYYGSMVYQVLIGKDHPLKNLAILWEGLQLALAQALNVAADTQSPFVSHLLAFISGR